MNIGSIKDISNYIGDTQFPCRQCGSVNTLEELVVSYDEETKRSKGICAHCDAFIKLMPTKKIDRVFWKGSMVEIAKIDTGLLMWFINKGVHGAVARKFIRIEILTRLDAPDVIPDIAPDSADERALRIINKAKMEIEHCEELIATEQGLIVKNWNAWDAPKMASSENYIKKWRKRIVFLTKKHKL